MQHQSSSARCSVIIFFFCPIYLLYHVSFQIEVVTVAVNTMQPGFLLGLYELRCHSDMVLFQILMLAFSIVVACLSFDEQYMVQSMDLEPMNIHQVGCLRWNPKVVQVSFLGVQYFQAVLICLIQSSVRLWRTSLGNFMVTHII